MDKHIFTPDDIVWFKNVNDNKNGEAYLDLKGDTFTLHFPSSQKNVSSPKPNEIILIYQKVNGVPAFTHLVTPVDDKLIDNHSIDYRYARKVRIIAKKGRDNYIPVKETLWGKIDLRSIIQGNVCKLENVKSIRNIEKLRLDVWQRFNGHFVSTESLSEKVISAIRTEIEMTNPDYVATEGGLHLISHMVRERNHKIVEKKKQQAIKNNTLKCEVCGFSFPATYKVNFIECHHRIPIHKTDVRETTLKDLALVCSNCHRMLHRKFGGQYLDIGELKKRINPM